MKRYLIAGLQVDMDVHGRTLEQAKPYEVEPVGEADIEVWCDPQKVLENNPGIRDLDGAEYMGTGTNFSYQMTEFGGFQLHSSAVMLEGKAYLFSAPSGTGKSTHTEKWCRLFGATLLNDDKPILRRQDGVWMAYGTPWSGKHDLSMPTGVPLGGIAFLMRGEENTICRMEPGEAVAFLISQAPRYMGPDRMIKQLELLDTLLKEVPVWQLHCNLDDEAARISWGAMGGGK